MFLATVIIQQQTEQRFRKFLQVSFKDVFFIPRNTFSNRLQNKRQDNGSQESRGQIVLQNNGILTLDYLNKAKI